MLSVVLNLLFFFFFTVLVAPWFFLLEKILDITAKLFFAILKSCIFNIVLSNFRFVEETEIYFFGVGPFLVTFPHGLSMAVIFDAS